MTVLCSICSKHSLIPEGPLLPTLKFVTEIKDTNNSSAKKYVAKISLRPLQYLPAYKNLYLRTC